MEIKLLLCPLCSHPHFDSVDTLRNTLVNVATSLLTCPVCCETLSGLDKLTIHLFSHVSATNNNFKEKFQEEIDKTIDDVSKNCEQPDDIAITNETVTNVIKCDICNFSFTDRNILEMHQKLLHQTSPDKNGSYNYHCHLCSKKFRMRGSLMVHLRVAHYGFGHNFKEKPDCPKPKSQQDIDNQEDHKPVTDIDSSPKRPSVKHDNKQWECDVCSKMFTTKYFLKKHKRLHTGEMPYCCSLCNKSFTFQQSYHKHMLYHSSEKPYVCNECGRAFKELSTLQNHARIHSGERPFSCETCGKSFRQRVSYLVHRRIHTGIMPYKCTACDKCFRYKVSQKSHKCPMSPPGSVVRIADPSTVSNNNIAMDINVKQDSDYCDSNNASIQKTSIVLENNQQIEITYNKFDLCSAIEEGGGNNSNSEKDHRFKVVSVAFHQADKMPPQKDLFSMALSPIIPEVESLCLSNSPVAVDFPVKEEITLITQKSLEDFL